MKFHSVLTPKTVFSVMFISLLCFVQHSFAQNKMDSIAKQQVMSMLDNVKNALKNDYYDPNPKFAGVDLETRFKAAEEKLKKTEYLPDAFAIIAQVVLDLNDSHTLFVPPNISTVVEYGWRVITVGDKSIVSGILENSDADKKGLKIGDEILAINGFRPTRKELWKVLYYYNLISPKIKLTLDVKSPAGEVRQLVINTKLTQLKKSINLTDTSDFNAAARESDRRSNLGLHYFREVGDAFIWKMPTFDFDPREVGGFIGPARNKRALILDLRGNSGGYVVTHNELAGYFFDHDVKISDEKQRKKTKTETAKTKGSDVFKGKLIILVDAQSHSASEVFARLMQIEKRGIVLGDITGGSVMTSRGKLFTLGVDDAFGYVMGITIADVFMSDGKSLEHVGVIPDELILPTGQDLAERRDPVMARALELSGHKIEASLAGRFFPVEKIYERTSNIALYQTIIAASAYD
jgi:C-terminal processing protease CtpA/Prc